jgi:hypothetical protein
MEVSPPWPISHDIAIILSFQNLFTLLHCTGQFHHVRLKNMLEFQDKSPSILPLLTLQECHDVPCMTLLTQLTGAPRSAVSWQMWPTVQSSAGNIIRWGHNGHQAI